MSEIKNLLAKMINKINSNEDRIENIEETVKTKANLATVDYVDDKVSKCPQAWIEYGEWVEFLPETQITKNSDGYLRITEISQNFTLGKRYKVIYNGVEYYSKVYDLEALMPGTNMRGVGNLGSAFLIPLPFFDNGLPFAVTILEVGDVLSFDVLGSDNPDSVTIAIYEESTNIHPLEEQYLPRKQIIFTIDSDDSIICNTDAETIFTAFPYTDFKVQVIRLDSTFDDTNTVHFVSDCNCFKIVGSTSEIGFRFYELDYAYDIWLIYNFSTGEMRIDEGWI